MFHQKRRWDFFILIINNIIIITMLECFLIFHLCTHYMSYEMRWSLYNVKQFSFLCILFPVLHPPLIYWRYPATKNTSSPNYHPIFQQPDGPLHLTLKIQLLLFFEKILKFRSNWTHNPKFEILYLLLLKILRLWGIYFHLISTGTPNRLMPYCIQTWLKA